MRLTASTRPTRCPARPEARTTGVAVAQVQAHGRVGVKDGGATSRSAASREPVLSTSMRTSLSLMAPLLALALGACSSEAPPEDAGSADAGSGVLDAAALEDGGPITETWSSFAEAFMQTYCVRCHSTSPKDFNSLADVRANTATIRCGVSDVALDGCGAFPPPRQFPVGSGPFPSDDERARLVAWLDAGAPE